MDVDTAGTIDRAVQTDEDEEFSILTTEKVHQSRTHGKACRGSLAQESGTRN